MKKRIILASLALLLLATPLYSVFKEENLKHTLSVLLMELKETYEGIIQYNGTAEKRIQEQHQRLVDLIDECNELSVMLYSQPSENTFDLTFALNEVTSQYEQFKSQSTPYAEIKAALGTELERYNRLVTTLRKMPPERTAEEIVQDMDVAVALDSASLALADSIIVETPLFAKEEGLEPRMDEETIQVRDSCLYVAEQIVAYYWMQLKQIEKDNEYYTQTDELLRSAYDYAQNSYEKVQQKLFVEGQGNYFKTLTHLPWRIKKAAADIKSRYSLRLDKGRSIVYSSWRGPIVFFYSIFLLLMLFVTTLLSTFIVNTCYKKIARLQTTWVKNHKGMLIALLGVLLFAIFLFLNSSLSSNTFFQRSSRIMGEFAWLIATIFVSMLIRLDRGQTRSTLMAYLPTLLLAFFIIYFRIIFIPNSLINLIFPALLFCFTIWQYWLNVKKFKLVARDDRILLWTGAVAITLATILSWAGVVMGSLLLVIWWMFQLVLLETIIAISVLLRRYHESRVVNKKKEYRRRNPLFPLSNYDGAYIEVSWKYDLIRTTLIPLLSLWSFPASVFMACNVFNFTGVAQKIFFLPVVDMANGFQLSLFKIILIASMFFVFRYIIYACKAFYRVWRTKAAISKLGDNVAFKETDINFNLANNIFTLLFWGIYVIIIFLVLKIPSKGLAIVSTGLATGIGFAMKDVLNNFFYGVQLMSGRVRVGDTVECDGLRGTVVGLSYQTTQIEATDGSVIFFTNSTLFNKNFKNLTRNHSYQILSLIVGVKYGTDVEKARQIIVDAINPLMTLDKYGREVVDRKKGVTVRLFNFADSAVELQVLLNTTVDGYFAFAAQVREAIYNAFAEGGIEIPFPQQDVYIKEMPIDDGGKK